MKVSRLRFIAVATTDGRNGSVNVMIPNAGSPLLKVKTGYERKLMEDLLQTYMKNLTPLIRSVTSSVPGRMKFRNQSTPILPLAATSGGMLILSPWKHFLNRI